MTEFIQIEPKCFPYDKDGNNIRQEMGNCPAHTATGYLLPCCWLDRPDIIAEDDNINGVRVPELNLDTGITYKEIMRSENWKRFYRELFEQPEKAHPVCKECCGKK